MVENANQLNIFFYVFMQWVEFISSFDYNVIDINNK